MSTWAEILACTEQLLSSLTGLQSVGENLPQPFVHANLRGKITYNVISVQTKGSTYRHYKEEQAWTYAPDGSRVPTVDEVGNPVMAVHLYLEAVKEFTLSVKFDGYDQNPARNALFYLDRIDTRIVIPENLATLRAVNVAFIESGAYRPLDSEDEHRVFSRGQKDFFFSAGISELASDSDVGYIESIEATSHYLYTAPGVPSDTQFTVTAP